MNSTPEILRAGRLTIACLSVTALLACGGGEPGPTSNAEPDAEQLSAHALAQAQRTVIFRSSDKVAIADFVERSAVDPCVLTIIQVVINKGRGRSDGVTTKYKAVNLQGFAANECTGAYEQTFYAGGSEEANVAINESRASARASILINYSSGGVGQGEIDLTWIGGSERSNSTKSISLGANVKLVSKSTDTFRFADVTGSLVIDGDDLLSASHNSGINGYVATYGQATIEIVRTP